MGGNFKFGGRGSVKGKVAMFMVAILLLTSISALGFGAIGAVKAQSNPSPVSMHYGLAGYAGNDTIYMTTALLPTPQPDNLAVSPYNLPPITMEQNYTWTGYGGTIQYTAPNGKLINILTTGTNSLEEYYSGVSGYQDLVVNIPLEL